MREMNAETFMQVPNGGKTVIPQNHLGILLGYMQVQTSAALINVQIVSPQNTEQGHRQLYPTIQTILVIQSHKWSGDSVPQVSDIMPSPIPRASHVLYRPRHGLGPLM